MLKNISNITNLGQFENFSSNNELSMNNIIFGFNGAGKSTLSDMFYSMAHENHEDIIIRRRTLNRDGEDGDKEINIEIMGDDNKSYLFSAREWNNRPDNMFVFNSQYIKEHVFVSRQVEGNAVNIMIGKEGAKYMRQREELTNNNATLIEDINRNIKILMDADLKIKDFSSSKITTKTTEKRLKQMAELSLYPVADKNKIEDRLKSNEKYTKELSVLDCCDELNEKLGYIDAISVALVKKHVSHIPRISSKEIAEYLNNSLTSTDIKWAVRGYLNRKNDNICPMCGQEIADKQAKQFFLKLGKYVCQNKDEKIKQLSEELQQLAFNLESIAISEKISTFNEILTKLSSNSLLLKRETDRFEKGLSWNSKNTEIMDNLVMKIKQKAENPFVDIKMSDEENNTIILLNSVIRNINYIGEVLQNVRERVEKKNDKKFSMDDMGRLFQLSYGVYRSIAEEIKSNVAMLLKNKEKITTLTGKINDCYNQNKLNSVNDFLMQLNTHIKIEVKHNNYFIKLKDFKEKSYEQSKETLLSEGERNAVAFAYFLTEIENTNISEKIIVIDDPISSMDLSRKSIISHKISEMMTNKLCQIIVMTHDITFVERVMSYLNDKDKEDTSLLELRSGKTDFIPLCIDDYLTDDKTIYKKFITLAEEDSDETDKIIALMSMRPYAYLNHVSDEEYKEIESKSSYFAHTLYSYNNRVKFKSIDYDNTHLKDYVKLVNDKTNSSFDENKIVGDYVFSGFDFEKICNLYLSVKIDSMDNLRRKVLMMRPLIEACFFQLSKKDKFDIEHIGKMYNSVTNSNSSEPEKKAMCKSLKELYDASKKYHHGAEEGSMLGVSWINPSEVEYFDSVICGVVEKIKDNRLVREIGA
ncbi:MAG: AAA family ATPase [Eubacteriales bacterium]|nr:AAA family ATPase [Eubacteriales bacterium]